MLVLKIERHAKHAHLSFAATWWSAGNIHMKLSPTNVMFYSPSTNGQTYYIVKLVYYSFLFILSRKRLMQ